MKKYKILALTDHSGHSQHNSLYALMETLAQHPQCELLYVASRGNAKNDAFFVRQERLDLEAIQVTGKFQFDPTGQQFVENQSLVSMSDFDVVLMRLPRPITDHFLQYLQGINPDLIFINHPQGIIETSTKAFLLNFPEVCPEMQLCKTRAEVEAFAKKCTMVLKPLKEYGGKGIVKITDEVVTDGSETLSLSHYLDTIEEALLADGYLAMKFLENVKQGDKRILVVNGEILASSLRLPAAGSWLCNVAQGGTSVVAEATAEEVAMIDKITPLLLEKGIVVFGADTLVDDDGKRVLSEVNTLSIGGFPQAAQQTGRPVVELAIDNIITYINKQ
jgi:glutathione synthase